MRIRNTAVIKSIVCDDKIIPNCKIIQLEGSKGIVKFLENKLTLMQL